MRGSDGASALVRLYEQVPNFRSAILKAIGTVQSPAAVAVLRSALGHADAPLRCAAVRGISLLGSVESISPLLLGPSQDATPEVREETAWALGRKHSMDGADTLKKLCRDASEAVRITAMESLDYAFPEVARGVLMELAADNSFPDRGKAIELLSRYRFPEVRKFLAFLCGDVESDVKQCAAESLSHIDTSLSVELKHLRVKKGHTIFHRLLRTLSQLIGIDEFKRLVLEERLRGAAGADPWFKAFGRYRPMPS